MAHNMDVFPLGDSVVRECRAHATIATIYADDIKEQIHAINVQSGYWPEPLIQSNPNDKRTTCIAKLVAAGTLQPQCSQTRHGRSQWARGVAWSREVHVILAAPLRQSEDW